MGAEFQPCKEANTHQNDKGSMHKQRQQIQSLKSEGIRFKLCTSATCLPSQPSNDLYLKFMDNRAKLNTQIKNTNSLKLSSANLTPQIRHSRVDLTSKKRKNPVDSTTIKRREALGRMLAEKLGLQPSNKMQLSLAERQNKQRLAEIVHKICINNQQHLIDIIDRMENSFRGSQTRSESSTQENMLERFLDSVSKTELDFLDMLYHNDGDLYQSGSEKLRFKRNIAENIVDIKEMMMEEKEFPGSAFLTYEKFKSQGLEIIKDEKVCFFVLAGGKSSRYLLSSASDNSSYPSSNPQSYRESFKMPSQQPNRSTSKDFAELNIPSERSIVELIIHRFIALGQLLNCHITLYLGISPDKINSLKDLFQRITVDQKKINLYPFAQKVIGALDSQGNLVVEDSGQASLWSVGTGDLWNIMRGDKELSFPNASELREQGFQYLQVFGTSNVLEKCFDCFSLGLAAQYDLDWTTKIVESYSKRHSRSTRYLDSSEIQNVQTKIFINGSQEIYVCDPQEIDNYPQSCRYTFMNNSLFKLQYLQNALQSPELENLWPRKKTHLTNNQPPFSRYRNVCSYEKDYTDIFRLATVKPPIPEFDHCSGLSGLSRAQAAAKWRLILCDQADFYPLIYKNGDHSDIEHASRALTDLHKTYLGIDNPLVRIEIDPYISLEGQRLQELKKDLKNQTLSQEEWIFIQRN